MHISPTVAEENRVAESFEPLKNLVAGVHIHDNHGEKDEHLPPYEGTIDWTAAVKLLKTAPESAQSAAHAGAEREERSGCTDGATTTRRRAKIIGSSKKLD